MLVRVIVQKLQQLSKISILKTLRFNLHYFGVRTFIIHGPYMILSRNVKISSMKGKVIVTKPIKRGILLGFNAGMPIYEYSYEKFIWHNNGTVVFNGNADLLVGCKIDNEGYIEFGENLYCNASTTIICKKKIKVGKNCAISWRSLLMDSDLHSIYDNKDNLINHNQPIIINDNVWIGCNVTILKGTEISSHSIVAAGATISNKKFKEENIIIGEFGKILKRDIKFDYKQPD